MVAIEHGFSDLALFLIAHGSDVNARTNKLGSPLMIASLLGQQNTALALITKGADLNAKNHQQINALMFACESEIGIPEVALTLIRKGCIVDDLDENGKSAYDRAVAHKLVDVCIALREAMNMSLSELVKKGHTIQYLWGLGHSIFDIRASGAVGVWRGGLMDGSGEEYVEGLELMQKAEKEKDGVQYIEPFGHRSLLHIACELSLENTALALLRRGANPAAVTLANETPLTIACANKLDSVVFELLHSCNSGKNLAGGEVMVDTNARSGEGLTPLMLSARAGRTNACLMLLYSKVDINAHDSHNYTALMYALMSGLSNVCLELVHMGCDVMPISSDTNSSALLLACKHHLSAVAVLLVSLRNHLDLSDNDGRSPLSYARANGMTLVVNALLEHGCKDNNTLEHHIHENRSIPELWSEGYSLDEIASSGVVFPGKPMKTKQVPYSITDIDNPSNDASLQQQQQQEQESATSETDSKISNSGRRDSLPREQLDNTPVPVRRGTSLFDTAPDAASDIAEEGNMQPKKLDFSASDAEQCNIKEWAGIEILRIVEDRGVNWRDTHEGNVSALMLACLYDQPLTALALVARGADVTLTDADGGTALLYACQGCKSSSLALKLIDKGANINAATRAGYTPLLWACSTGLRDVAKALINKGCNINATSLSHGYSALHMACYTAASDVAMQLIERGADVASVTAHGHTPLTLARQNNLRTVVERIESQSISLVSVGKARGKGGGGIGIDGSECFPPSPIRSPKRSTANTATSTTGTSSKSPGTFPSSQPSHQRDPILDHRAEKLSNLLTQHTNMFALWGMGFQCAEILDGVHVFDSISPLGKPMDPIISLEGIELLKRVEDRGLEFKRDDKRKGTPLIWACVNCRVPFALSLIERGADVNATNDLGWSPLLVACSNNLSDLCNSLVDKGATINMADKTGKTPLFWAISNDMRDIACTLIHSGASVNVVNSSGTPLLLTCIDKLQTEVCVAMIANGADCSVRNIFGKSSLSLAMSKQLHDLVKAIVKAQLHDTTLSLQCKDKDGTPILAYLIKNNMMDIAIAVVDWWNGDHDHLSTLLDIQDSDGNTPLRLAVKFKMGALGVKLIKAGADYTIMNNQGRGDGDGGSLLITSVKCALVDVSIALLDIGGGSNSSSNIQYIDTSITDKNGQTAMNIASALGQADVMVKLFKRQHAASQRLRATLDIDLDLDQGLDAAVGAGVWAKAKSSSSRARAVQEPTTGTGASPSSSSSSSIISTSEVTSDPTALRWGRVDRSKGKDKGKDMGKEKGREGGVVSGGIHITPISSSSSYSDPSSPSLTTHGMNIEKASGVFLSMNKMRAKLSK